MTEPGAIEDWDTRLGWMRALVSDDEVAHRRALDRYLGLARETRETRAAYDMIVVRMPRSVSAEEDAWERFRTAWAKTPAAVLLTEPLAPEDVPSWPGLPYALTYLEWEAHYPVEWTRHAKVWSTKQRLIRRLAVPGHDDATRARLTDLVELVVNRRHRCKDREYSRIARAVDGEDLRARLEKIRATGAPWARDQAGHVLWLLRNPQVPINRANWFRWLSAHGTDAKPTPVPEPEPDGPDGPDGAPEPDGPDGAPAPVGEPEQEPEQEPEPETGQEPEPEPGSAPRRTLDSVRDIASARRPPPPGDNQS
ncbi:hypothetical protein [Embleya sp. NBC_00896]|uniref:hypothetical protein n=1 Tax=Embleya sp. NBC_00896 TaxID=2975961 RepID=UPI0038631B13|nr:procyclic acidic repetitive family protein [Embleya sp. NBC_00896]